MRSAVRACAGPVAVTVVLVGLTIAAASSASGSPAAISRSADSVAVAGVISGFHDAIASGDSSRALAALAGDVVILESGGVESRAEYRSHHLSDDIAFSRAVKSVSGPLSVTIDGNTGWTRATSATQGAFKGRQINSTGAESMVLTRSKGVWKIRSIHWSSHTRRAAG